MVAKRKPAIKQITPKMKQRFAQLRAVGESKAGAARAAIYPRRMGVKALTAFSARLERAAAELIEKESAPVVVEDWAASAREVLLAGLNRQKAVIDGDAVAIAAKAHGKTAAEADEVLSAKEKMAIGDLVFDSDGKIRRIVMLNPLAAGRGVLELAATAASQQALRPAQVATRAEFMEMDESTGGTGGGGKGGN